MEKYKELEGQLKNFVSKPIFDQALILQKNAAFPKISIITPSYNQGQFLERTILSILNQNYPNLELIVIDGGSKDKTLDIIKKYEKFIDYWVSEKDNGQTHALNKGFKKATGEIVGWQNSDDVYLPGSFKEAAEFFKKNKKTGVVFSNRLDIDENDNVAGESRFAKFSNLVCLYESIPLGTQGLFWKRSLFEKTGYLDEKLIFPMDYEFVLRLAKAGAKFSHVRQIWGAIRRHGAAKTEMYLGTDAHTKETNDVAYSYGRKKHLEWFLKPYALLYRTFWYIIHGDGDYVLSGLLRRIKF